MKKLEQYPFPEEPAGSEPEEFLYEPTPAVRRLFAVNSELLIKIRSDQTSIDQWRTIERYSEATAERVAESYGESEKVMRRAANDGNNLVCTIIVCANAEADPRRFVAEGRDLEIAAKILKSKTKKKYGNLSSYKLWAGLYLDLREELFGLEQNEDNIKAINRLRETITS